MDRSDHRRQWLSVAVAEGTVYCGSEDGHLYALDIESGIEKWRFKAGGPLSTAPIYVDGLICFGSADGHLYVLN